MKIVGERVINSNKIKYLSPRFFSISYFLNPIFICGKDTEILRMFQIIIEKFTLQLSAHPSHRFYSLFTMLR
jgi:hypothetical protein